MHQERLYTTITKDIELKTYNEEIKLWLFGDIHRFTKSCDEEKWNMFLKEAKRTHDKNTYYIGLGDYTDFASTKEMRALQAEMHLQTMIDLDDFMEKRNRILASEMSFMKPNVIGLIDGNHGWTFQNGKRATEDLCERLDANFLGWISHITLRLTVLFGNNDVTVNVYIVVCHGKSGGGKTAGLTINQVDDLRAIFPMADIYGMGHDHQRAARYVSVILPYIKKTTGVVELKSKRQLLCRTGSFKKAYISGEASYEVARLLRPADLGAVKIKIKMIKYRNRKDGVNTYFPDIMAEL